MPGPQTMAKALLVGIFAALAAPAWSQPPPPGPAPGRLIDVGGHRMHIRCEGPDGSRPTVLLEAGGGGYSATWSRVQDLLASRRRLCAYDRAGLGWSDPGPAPRTMRQEVFELHELLNAAGIRGPLVMVGHSIGGLLVRLYAERYADDVVGMVLVDPTHESEVLFNLPKNAWVRVRDLATDRIVPEPQLAPSEIQPGDDYLAEELQLIYLARKAAPVPLGDRPLVVLAAGRRPAPPGVSDERWNEMKVEKGGQRIDLSELSTNSKFVLDPASRHEIQSDDPPLVARAIEEVLDALATGRRLTP